MLQKEIRNIENLNAKDAERLEEIIEKYPYCQSAHLLYAVALANIHSTRLKAQVLRAATTMPDRLKLCQLVSNGEFEWITLMNEIEARKKAELADSSTDDFLLIERYLDNIGEVPTDTLPYDISSAPIGDYSLDADFESEQEPDDTYALIDSFIEAEEKGELFVPRAQKILDTDEDNDDALSLKKIREKAFLSESLAKIYVKQHKYEQAIAIFSALNLKYSKKFTYFADQIRYLETILSYEKGEENNSEK